MAVFLLIIPTQKLFLRVNSNSWKFAYTQRMFQCLADLISTSSANGPTYYLKNFSNKGMLRENKT